MLPFQPPKAMRLPASTVTIESVGPALPNGLVPIMMTATNTSLYVTLTCAVAGRFSVRAEGIWPPRLLLLIPAPGAADSKMPS